MTRMAILGAVLLAACVSGAARADAEIDAVRNIKKLGGDIKRDADMQGQPVAEAYLWRKKMTDEVLASAMAFPRLIILEVTDAAVTDKGALGMTRRDMLRGALRGLAWLLCE